MKIVAMNRWSIGILFSARQPSAKSAAKGGTSQHAPTLSALMRQRSYFVRRAEDRGTKLPIARPRL
jgi:hypothetical protein